MLQRKSTSARKVIRWLKRFVIFTSFEAFKPFTWFVLFEMKLYSFFTIFTLYYTLYQIIYWWYIHVECGIGLYGEKCTQQCSGNCKDNETCNHVTGQCDNGCTTGWKGDMCDNGNTWYLYFSPFIKYLLVYFIQHNLDFSVISVDIHVYREMVYFEHYLLWIKTLKI